jgi:hypothetical protein
MAAKLFVAFLLITSIGAAAVALATGLGTGEFKAVVVVIGVIGISADFMIRCVLGKPATFGAAVIDENSHDFFYLFFFILALAMWVYGIAVSFGFITI